MTASDPGAPPGPAVHEPIERDMRTTYVGVIVAEVFVLALLWLFSRAFR